MHNTDLSDPSFWLEYDKYLMSNFPVDQQARDEELLNRIEANPPPKEYDEPIAEQLVA